MMVKVKKVLGAAVVTIIVADYYLDRIQEIIQIAIFFKITTHNQCFHLIRR